MNFKVTFTEQNYVLYIYIIEVYYIIQVLPERFGLPEHYYFTQL